MLSDDTASHLRAALREHCSEAGNPSHQLHALVADAAIEARTGQVTAEQFVIWVKKLWDDVIAEGVLPRSADTLRARDVIVSSAIKAYYVQ